MSTIRSATAACLTASGMGFERRRAVDRVDHRDDAVEPVAHHEIGMRHRGVQHRSGVGEAGGLDDHPRKSGAAIVEIAQQALQRLDEVAAHGAAQASRRQQHDAFVDLLHQQVIEADLAELVDDDGGIGKRRVLQQAIEEGGFAGSEKAGQHAQRKRWARRSRGFARTGHCASVRGGAGWEVAAGFGLTAATVGLGAGFVLSPAVAAALGFSAPAGLGWSVAVGRACRRQAWQPCGPGGRRGLGVVRGPRLDRSRSGGGFAPLRDRDRGMGGGFGCRLGSGRRFGRGAGLAFAGFDRRHGRGRRPRLVRRADMDIDRRRSQPGGQERGALGRRQAGQQEGILRRSQRRYRHRLRRPAGGGPCRRFPRGDWAAWR